MITYLKDSRNLYYGEVFSATAPPRPRSGSRGMDDWWQARFGTCPVFRALPVKPGAPTRVRAFSGTAGAPINASATWDFPESVGSSRLTAYRVRVQRMRPDGRPAKWRKTVTVEAKRESLLMKLPRKARYRFRVAAENDVGAGPWSAWTATVRGR